MWVKISGGVQGVRRAWLGLMRTEEMPSERIRARQRERGLTPQPPEPITVDDEKGRKSLALTLVIWGAELWVVLAIIGG